MVIYLVARSSLEACSGGVSLLHGFHDVIQIFSCLFDGVCVVHQRSHLPKAFIGFLMFTGNTIYSTTELNIYILYI